MNVNLNETEVNPSKQAKFPDPGSPTYSCTTPRTTPTYRTDRQGPAPSGASQAQLTRGTRATHTAYLSQCADCVVPDNEDHRAYVACR